MVTSAVLVASLTCLMLGETVSALMSALSHSASAHQGSRLMLAHVGETVSLQCLHDSDDSKYYWYKQTLGHKLRLISVTYRSTKASVLVKEFRNSRFTVDVKDTNILNISDVQLSDSATYHCATTQSYVLEFLLSVTVIVKAWDLSRDAWVHQSESESVHPGDSVTLNCTVHTQTCDGEHSVYWFKKSQDPRPGIIYSHRDGDEQCERKNHTQTHTCVYNLHIRSMDRDHTGTYYCAVASCGQVLFGKGTTLDCKYEAYPPVLVYYLNGALAITTTLLVCLVVSVYRLSRRNSCRRAEYQETHTSATHTESYREDLHYAAVRVNPANAPRKQRKNQQNDCVYSGVRQSE